MILYSFIIHGTVIFLFKLVHTEFCHLRCLTFKYLRPPLGPLKNVEDFHSIELLNKPGMQTALKIERLSTKTR